MRGINESQFARTEEQSAQQNQRLQRFIALKQKPVDASPKLLLYLDYGRHPPWKRRTLRRDVRRGGLQVSEVRVKENETLESALKRFKRQCARSGVLAEVRKREHYEKPSVKRKKKMEAARKRKF